MTKWSSRCGDQGPNIAVCRVLTGCAGVRPAGTHIFIDVRNIPGYRSLDFSRVPAEPELSLGERDLMDIEWHVLRSGVDQNLVPIDLQIRSDTNP